MQTLGVLVKQTPWLQPLSYLTFLFVYHLYHIPTRSPPPNTAQLRVLERAFEHAEQHPNRSQLDLFLLTMWPWPSDATRWRGLRPMHTSSKPDIYAAVPGLDTNQHLRADHQRLINSALCNQLCPPVLRPLSSGGRTASIDWLTMIWRLQRCIIIFPFLPHLTIAVP